MKLNYKTKEQVEQEERERKIQSVERNRQNAYQKESDPLFFKWKRGSATEQEWKDKVAEIKSRFPYPDEQ